MSKRPGPSDDPNSAGTLAGNSQGLRRAGLAGAVVIPLAALLAMAPVLTNQFVSWDDYQTVARNVHLNPPSWQAIGYYWTHPHMHLWVPVTYTVWTVLAALNYLFAPGAAVGLSAGWFHGASLLLHIGAALVVWRLLRRLLKHEGGALAGALLFAVHPVQVESVAWASGLKDLLCGLLMWASVLLYLRWSGADPADPHEPDAAAIPVRRLRWYGWATAAFVLALLAKPTAMVVPLLAVVLEAVVLRRPIRRYGLALGAWLLLSVACGLWTRAVQPPTSMVAQPPVYLRPLVATDALAFYAIKLAWPIGLTIDHGRRPDVVLSRGWACWTWVVPLIAGAGLLLAWRRMRRGGGNAATPELIPASALFFLIPLAPVLGLVPFDFQQYSTVAEHYLYPAMVGPALLLGLLVARLWPGVGKLAPASAATVRKARTITAVALVAVLPALVVLSHVQARNWADNRTLFAHAARVNPDSYAATNSLASALAEAGEAGPAIEYARRAIELMPGNEQAYVTLGAALSRRGDASRGDLPAAIAAYHKAAELAPRDPVILAQLGGLLAMTGHVPEGLRHLQAALEVDPENGLAHQNLGTLYAQIDRPEDALRHMGLAVRYAPHSAIAQANLGLPLMDKGQFAEAQEHFEAALRIQPDHAMARRGLMETRRILSGSR